MEKLSEYAKTQLPGGLYWEPDPEVHFSADRNCNVLKLRNKFACNK